MTILLLKKLLKLTQDLWNMIGIALLMFVALEVGLSLTFYLRSFWHQPAPEFRAKADTYNALSADAAWAETYYKEIDQMGKTRWRSYVYWRRAPSQGKYINLNADGLRQTSQVTNAASPSLKVFMFGGSTLWGLGARDDFTVPSLFAKDASAAGINCEVINFGQYAYVSTQGVIELMLQLQKGNIPDAVIFLDGINDTFGAFQAGVPGLPHGEISREKEFNLLQRKEIGPLAVQAGIRELTTMRFLNGFLKKLGLRHDTVRLIPLEYETPIADRASLAKATVETYLNNLKMVQALSRAYGFKCLFYWQPVIYLKQHLTEYERKSIEDGPHYPGMKEFYLDTYATLRQRTGSLPEGLALHDISALFSAVQEPLYIDFNHLGEKGNSLIAHRMAEDFVRLAWMNQKTAEPGETP